MEDYDFNYQDELFNNNYNYQIGNDLSLDLSNDADGFYQRFTYQSDQQKQKQFFDSTKQGQEDQQNLEETQENDQSETPEKNGQETSQKIQIGSDYLLKLAKVKEGKTNETVNLLKVLKCLLLNHFKTLKMSQILTLEEITVYQTFKDESPSFKSLHKFFQNEKIKQKSHQYLSSPQFAKNTLSSKTLQFQRKIEVLKYLEKFRKGTEEPLTQWKDN